MIRPRPRGGIDKMAVCTCCSGVFAHREYGDRERSKPRCFFCRMRCTPTGECTLRRLRREGVPG